MVAVVINLAVARLVPEENACAGSYSSPPSRSSKGVITCPVSSSRQARLPYFASDDSQSAAIANSSSVPSMNPAPAYSQVPPLFMERTTPAAWSYPAELWSRTVAQITGSPTSPSSPSSPAKRRDTTWMLCELVRHPAQRQSISAPAGFASVAGTVMSWWAMPTSPLALQMWPSGPIATSLHEVPWGVRASTWLIHGRKANATSFSASAVVSVGLNVASSTSLSVHGSSSPAITHPWLPLMPITTSRSGPSACSAV